MYRLASILGVPDVLIYGDTIRSPELRHEVPVAVPDPFLYVERDGSRYAFVGSLEVPRMREIAGLEAVPLEIDDEGNSATWGDHVTDEEYGAAPPIDQLT